MQKLLHLLLIALFVLSLIPPTALSAPAITPEARGTPHKLIKGSHTDYYWIAETTNYVGIVAVSNKGNYRGDLVLQVYNKADGSIVFNGTIATDNARAPYITSNGTDFLIVYAEYDGSNYDVVAVVHDGVMKKREYTFQALE